MAETKELPKIEDIVSNEKRKVYVVQISFDAPDSGPIQLLARDEDHARELCHKMLAHLKNLVIHDVIDQSKIVKPEVQETPASETPVTPVMVH